MSSPDITPAEIDAVNHVLRTPLLSIGPQIEAFEDAVASYVGALYAIAVSSGTAGLHLGVIAADVHDGDLVITSPFSFVASANCILYERGVPIFVDVDPKTGNLDPALVAEAVYDLNDGPQTAGRWIPKAGLKAEGGRLKAVLPVHAFGQPANMEPILEVAQQYGLKVIEDACEAIGAEYRGRPAGTLGDVGVFAFYPNKQMTTGEGGLLVTDDASLANLFRSLRNQGRDVFDEWLNHSQLGYSYRLDEMSAALGLAQMRRIEELLAKRERVASWYNERLCREESVEVPRLAVTTTRMSWFVYVVRVKPPVQRSVVMQLLWEAGVPSRPYFTPIHLQPFYREKFGYQRGDFPVTEYLGDASLALPFSGVMTEEQVDYVCDQLRACLARATRS